MAVLIGQEQIGFGALADDLQLGAQRVQFLALGQGRLLDHVVRRPPGDLGHAVQRFVPLLCKVAVEQDPLRAAHQHDAQHHQGGHHGEKGCGDTFTHY